MTIKESVMQALKTKKLEESSADALAIKEEWLDAIGSLFEQLQMWMRDAVEQQLLVVRAEQRTIQEERIGTYVVPVLNVAFPGGVVTKIAPKARFIIGAKGRVDLESPPMKVILIRTEKGGWEFAELQALQGWQYRPLTEESFWDVLGRLSG